METRCTTRQGKPTNLSNSPLELSVEQASELEHKQDSQETKAPDWRQYTHLSQTAVKP